MIENIVFPPLKDTDEDGLFCGVILALMVKEEMRKRELLANFYGQKGSSACNEQASSLFQQST